MPRALYAAILSAPFICLLNLGLLLLLLTAGWAVALDVMAEKDMHTVEESLEGLGVILIGWGVALEERHSLRGVAGVIGRGDEAHEEHVDHLCHSAGLGLLLLGLFSEIVLELVKVPNHVIATEGFDWLLLKLSLLLAAGGIVLLGVNVVQLAGQSVRRRQAG